LTAAILRKLGHRLWNVNESVDETGLNRLGTSILATVFDLVAGRRHAGRDLGGSGLQESQDPAGGFYGSDCHATVDGLDVQVLEGVPWFRPSGTPTAWAPSWVPAPVEDISEFTLDANASGSTRVDLVYATQSTDDAESSLRRVLPVDQPLAELTLDTHRGYLGTIAVLKGTPGAGVPATPAGALAIAEITIPTGSTATTIADVRNLLLPDDGHEHIPDADGFLPYAAYRVNSGCAVSQDTGMTLAVAGGYIDFGGVRTLFAHNDTPVTIATADATNPRIDLVYISASTRQIAVAAGTPAVQPYRPASPAPGYDIPLAWVRVGAGVTSIVTADITDCRRTTGAADIVRQRRTIFPLVDVSADGVPSAGDRLFKIQAVDQDGLPYAGVVRYRCELLTVDTVAAHTLLEWVHTASVIAGPTEPTNDQWYVIAESDANGHLALEAQNKDASTVDGFVRITPIAWIDAGSSSADPAAMPAYIPGSAVEIEARLSPP
jgi:hypothetical protein